VTEAAGSSWRYSIEQLYERVFGQPQHATIRLRSAYRHQREEEEARAFVLGDAMTTEEWVRHEFGPQS
jgi:plasmid stability protein